jgi:serine/threonine protein kinase/class 3 adenylate cyclase/tetratricopeptide (TPR) repeat protein
MNPERYQQVSRLYNAALELNSGKRVAFLDVACGDDEELRREVESLLAAHRRVGNYFAAPALKVAAGLLAAQQAPSLTGRSISHYQVISQLGSGGMGEVYLALDTRLGRRVALKLLPKEFTQDQERVKRFEQEARAASALNHPNIITIYEIRWAEERHFIVTEYIEGQTLREQMTSGPMRIGAALEIAIQVASALLAAHEVGIVHRDIKPENIMVRRDGLVKVLDFGLAKLTEQRSTTKTPAVAESESSDIAVISTVPGMVMGTPQYMSPEQVRGVGMEARSDIFSLGIVLYEMVAGRRPFTGRTPSDVLAAILEREFLPLAQCVPGIPSDMERIVRKALAKNLEERYQVVEEMRLDLKNLHRELEAIALEPYIPCPQCTQGNPAAHAFCCRCGASLRKQKRENWRNLSHLPLPPSTTPPLFLRKPCPGCGKELDQGALICGQCGHRFADLQYVTETLALQDPPAVSVEETQPIPPPEGERRQAAVVSSILAGFMALVEHLPPKEVELVVGKVRSSIVEIVQRHGGTVTQFTGGGMTALFGIPTAYEDDFVRAVKASLEFHAEVREMTAELERGLGHEVRMCTGVTTGPVITQLQSSSGDKYRVTGDTLLVAAKLAAQAEPDEVLVGEETRRLVAPFFKTETGEPLPLKLKSAPVMTYRVLCESGAQTKLEAAQALGLTQYTGREKELITLQTLYNKALKGEGQFVTIVGEAGAGKSRLLLELRRSLGEAPATTLQGRCQSYGGNIPYQPFIDVLRDALNLQEGDSPARLVSEAISGIRAIDPDLEIYIPLCLHLLSLASNEHALPGHLQGEDLHLAILEALSAIFTLRTKCGLVLMLLEDWHWADEGSEKALKKLVGMAASYPLIIVVTCRPERSFNWAFLNHHTELHLGPLDASSSISIVKSILEADVLPEGLGDLLYRRTGGNPFFIEEVCRTLIENGRVQILNRRVILNSSLEEFDLPDTVQAVIRARLDRLDRETLRVLCHASVIGQEFNRPILERTFESRHQLSHCLENLQALGLIHQVRVLPEATYHFNHMLTQEVAYDSMLLHQRRSLHEAVGQAIEDLSRDRIEERLDLLAYHFSRAENWAKAVHYAREASERAVRLIRFSEALGMLEKVEGWLSKLPESKATMVEVLLEQERLCETLGLRERQQALIDRFLSLLDPVSDQALLAEVYIRQGELYALLKRFAEAERLLSESLAIRQSLSDRVGERRALRSLGFLCWQQGRNEEALAYNQSALDVDKAMNDATGYMQDLTNIGTVLRTQGEPEKALEALKESIQISVALGRLHFEVYALGIIANVYRDLGEIEKAVECLQRGLEVARQNRMPFAQIINMRNLASMCGEQGWVEECLRLRQELVSLVRSLDIKSELAQALNDYGHRLLEIGRVEDARPPLLEAAELFSRLGEKEKELLTLTSLARIYEQSADGYARYLATWQRIRDLQKERREPAEGNAALKERARQVRQAGDQHSALRYYQEALDLAAETGDAAQQGDLLNTMGIIEWERANYSRALQHYERARQIFEELNDPIHAGLMLNCIGVTLKAIGRLDEALCRLEEAIRVHRASGEKLFEGHALAAMGDVLSELGLLEEAADHYRGSLELRREVGDRQGEGWMLHHLSKIYAAQGAPDRARDLLGQSLAIAGDIGSEQLKQACIQLQV